MRVLFAAELAYYLATFKMLSWCSDLHTSAKQYAQDAHAGAVCR
jgi:hypothetical protein